MMLNSATWCLSLLSWVSKADKKFPYRPIVGGGGKIGTSLMEALFSAIKKGLPALRQKFQRSKQNFDGRNSNETRTIEVKIEELAEITYYAG